MFPLAVSAGLVRVSELRILGVLQRLALSYCAVGLMQVFFAHSRDALQVGQVQILCEWVTEWMGEWVGEWVSGWVSEWVSELVDGLVS